MLVFSPHYLPQIFDALIVDYRPICRDITPASTLYMLTRFACLTCDQEWLEELVDGATHEIEEVLFVSLRLEIIFSCLTVNVSGIQTT